MANKITLDPPPGIYSDPITITPIIDDSVQVVIKTEDGTTPTLAEYIAYDSLNPPNPFIAAVQDGRGNVTFDGGFPKFYNNSYNTGWTSFSQLPATYKYFRNVLNFISNKDKVAAGNNRVLFLGDANVNESYSIKSTQGNGFYTSITGLCAIAGYVPVLRTPSDFSSGKLEPSYSFLEEHCAVVVFSTRSLTEGNGFFTPQAISNIVTYRENDNGFFIITDHGTGKNGFYVTGNQLANEFGAYFEGDFNRTPVNVGFLRANYGDHPLYADMLDSESIYAGGSESRVFITEYDTYTPIDIPPLSLDTSGYHSYKFLLRDSNGVLTSHNFTYGLGVPEVVVFKDSQGNPIDVLDIGVGNRALIDFDLNTTGIGAMSGLIKLNNYVVGEVEHDGAKMTTHYYRHEGANLLVNNGDVVTVQITSPLEYVKNLSIKRFQPTIDGIYTYGEFLKDVNNPEWLANTVNRNEVSILDHIQENNQFDHATNINIIKGYLDNTGEIPEATALIYASSSAASAARQTAGAPSQQEIFNTWAVFSSHGNSETFFPSRAVAPNSPPYSTWIYNASLGAIVQTNNVNEYTAFVSPEKLDRYELEVTLTSSNGDDDVVGIVAAHYWDEASQTNHNLSFVVQTGGVYGTGRPIVAVRNHNTTLSYVVDESNHDVTFDNATGGNGWSGRRMRLKVSRNQNIIKMIATRWDVLGTYVPDSEIIIDLNGDPELRQFLGPQSYGYSSHSQAQSTFENIVFTGGVNYDFVVDMQAQVVYRYNTISLAWESTGITVQDLYGYPRQVRNPSTGETFYITENDVVQTA